MQVARKAEFELVPKSEQCSFALREFKLPAFASPWHFHPEVELAYIVQSQGRRFVGDSIAPFGPGDLVLVGANLPHFWHNDIPARGANPAAHSVVIQFRPDDFGPGFFALSELTGVKRLLHAAGRGLQFAPLRQGRQRLTIFCDRTGLEVFASDGLCYVPMPFQPKADDRSLLAGARGGAVKFDSLQVHELKPAWHPGM